MDKITEQEYIDKIIEREKLIEFMLCRNINMDVCGNIDETAREFVMSKAREFGILK